MRQRMVSLVLALAATAVIETATPVAAADLPRLAARRAVERSVHQTYPDLTFGNVACPSVRRARGVQFTCTVQLPGTFLVVDARQTDRSGTVAFSTRQAVIATQALRDFVAANASIPASVDCGPVAWRVARAGQMITCRASLADGTARSVQLTVLDTEGNVQVSAVR